jgi:hypothetical protein
MPPFVMLNGVKQLVSLGDKTRLFAALRVTMDKGGLREHYD